MGGRLASCVVCAGCRARAPPGESMSADLRERAERVKRDLSDPLAVAQALGLEVGEKGTHSVKVKCPWHQEKIASCNVRVGTDGTIGVKCFGCDKGGSVLDLVGACHGLGLRGQDFARVVELAEQLAGIAP